MKNNVIKDMRNRFFCSLSSKDSKVISSAIKVCLHECFDLNGPSKNDDELFDLINNISKYFKSEYDFFCKVYDEGLLLKNSHFYRKWLQFAKNEQEIDKVKKCESANMEKVILQTSKFTTLTNFLLSFPNEISNEEFHAARFVSFFVDAASQSKEVYDHKVIYEFENNYGEFIQIINQPNMEDTVNQTLLKIRPLRPGSTPTVNTREACIFIDELIHKPAFDSSDESEDFFANVTNTAYSELHKSINIYDIWKSPVKNNDIILKQDIHPDYVHTNHERCSLKGSYPNTTSGVVTTCSDNRSTSQAVSMFKNQTLVKPVLTTPFAKFKNQFGVRKSDNEQEDQI